MRLGLLAPLATLTVLGLEPVASELVARVLWECASSLKVYMRLVHDVQVEVWWRSTARRRSSFHVLRRSTAPPRSASITVLTRSRACSMLRQVCNTSSAFLHHLALERVQHFYGVSEVLYG